MTDRNPDQVVADNALEDAIGQLVRAYDLISADEVVTAWVLVGAAQGPDYGKTSYFHTFPGGNLPTHVALGLLDVAHHEIEIRGEDDE